MSRKGWVVLGGLVGLVALAGQVSGAARTPVTVKFVLDAYHAYFLPAQRAEIEAKTAARITERLLAYVPHFDFTTDPGKPYTLTVRLATRLTAERPDAPKEVGLHMELTGPKVTRAREYVVFRVPEDMRPITTVEAMVQEIDDRMPESEYAGRIGELLVRVPIAQGGRVVYQPRNGWILPHRPADICLDLGSRLAIESTVPSAVGPRLTQPLEALAVAEFNPPGPTHVPLLRGHIFTEPVDGSRFQLEMGGAPEEQITVNGVWIKKRESAAVCQR